MAPGRRRAERVRARFSRTDLRRLLPLGLGILVAAGAWVFLVRAAIDFGHAARNGKGALGWVMTVGAGVAATACLMLLFVLVARVRDALAPRRPSATHRH